MILVADATSTIAAATRTYNQNQQQQAELDKQTEKQKVLGQLAQNSEALDYYKNLDAVKQEEYLRQYSPDYAKASQANQDWGMGGDKSRAVNAVTMAVTGALGGQTDLQVVANTLAPYAANVIGKEFGHGEDKNTAAQLTSHAILGAALAYVNGGDPTAGGSAVVASEAAADYLTNQYKDKKEYQDANGEFQPNLLPEDVKTQIRDLTTAIGAVVGGTVGDSAFEAQLAGVVGQNAVENNKTSYKQSISNSLLCWNKACAEQYKNMDVVQEAAFRKGQDQAVSKFVNDIKNLPNVPQEVYEAVKNDPKGVAKAVYEGVKQIPSEMLDTGKTIVKVNAVGDTPAEFEALGKAEMTTALNVLSAALSAGTVTVVKKGGTVTIEAVKNVNKVPKIYVNNVGVKEVKITSTPLEGHTKLNIPDQGKLKPAEAAAGAQLEKVLGSMEKYKGTTTTKNPDWEITSGPNKGKTVDAMYTTDKLNQKEIDGLNKFYEKNMTKGTEKDKIQDHLGKADIVPIDFRVLNSKNQEIFLNYVKTLPKSQQSQFLILR